MRKTTRAPTYIAAPTSPVVGKPLVVKDGKGDSAVNPIIFTPASGTVDGQSSYTIKGPYNSATFKHNGSEWSVF